MKINERRNKVIYHEKKVNYDIKHTQYSEKGRDSQTSTSEQNTSEPPSNTIPKSELLTESQPNISYQYTTNQISKKREKYQYTYGKDLRKKAVHTKLSNKKTNRIKKLISAKSSTSIVKAGATVGALPGRYAVHNMNNKDNVSQQTEASEAVTMTHNAINKLPKPRPSRLIRLQRKPSSQKNTSKDQNTSTVSRQNGDKPKKKIWDGVKSLLKEALKAIARLIRLILTTSSPIGVAIIAILLVLLILVSFMGIFVANNDGSVTNAMNEIVSDYQEKISNIKSSVSYDTISIEGNPPNWKEIILAYCGKYTSTEPGETQEVFADFNDISKARLKTVFWDMVTISYTTETYTEGKTNHTKLVIDIESLTASEYAEKKSYNKEQLWTVNQMSATVTDEYWNMLLAEVNPFRLAGGYGVLGEFVYYDQTQYYNAYGDDTIAGSGCGPTSLAMVATYLTGESITPVDAIWCGDSFYVPGVGTSWSYFSAAAYHFGFRMEEQTGYFSRAVEALEQGKVVISAQSAGIFTRGGHFIVLAGIDENGKIIVYDPNGGNGYNPNGEGAAFSQAQVSASGTMYWIFDSDLNQGGNVAEQVWRYLRGKGLSKVVSAAIIGNMMTECGGHTLDLDYDIHGHYAGDTYYGLCQWNLRYTPSIDGKSVRGQLDHLWTTMPIEFSTFGFCYQSGFNFEQFKSMTDVSEAAAAFAACYERCGYENNYYMRRQNAMKAYNHFKSR